MHYRSGGGEILATNPDLHSEHLSYILIQISVSLVSYDDREISIIIRIRSLECKKSEAATSRGEFWQKTAVSMTST